MRDLPNRGERQLLPLPLHRVRIPDRTYMHPAVGLVDYSVPGYSINDSGGAGVRDLPDRGERQLLPLLCMRVLSPSGFRVQGLGFGDISSPLFFITSKLGVEGYTSL